MASRVFSVVFLLLVCTVQSVLAQKTTLGIIIPITGSAASMGQSLQGVVQLAELKHLSVRFEDDRCDAKTALSAYLKLKNEGVRLFYMACSGSILAVAPHAKRNGDLILTSYAGSLRIRDTGDEVIRLNPDALSLADEIARLITPDLSPSVILYEEQEYASSLADRLKELRAADIQDSISYRPDAGSYRAEILRIKQRKPKSIIFVPVGDSAAQIILKQLAENQVAIPIIGEVNLCDYPFKLSDFKLHGKCLAARLSGNAYEKFLGNYKAKFGYASAYPFYDAIAYDLFLFLDQILVRSQDVASIKKSILSGFSGLFAKYEFSSDGEVLNSKNYLVLNEY